MSLHLALLPLAAVFGAVFGSFVNVVAYRVPAGTSLLRESRCPNCDRGLKWYENVPVIGWLAVRGRCAGCGWGIPVRYPLVEAITGLLFALVAWLVPLAPLPLGAQLAVLAAFWWFAAVSVALVLIDLDTRRLPDVIVLPSYVVSLLLLGLACLLGASWLDWFRALAGMAVLYAGYALLRFLRPGGMGGGDVKLAGVVGIYLGWLGWAPLAIGALAAFVLGGVFGVALLASGRAQRRTAIAFGPWLLAGAWLGLLAGAQLGTFYLGLVGIN